MIKLQTSEGEIDNLDVEALLEKITAVRQSTIAPFSDKLSAILHDYSARLLKSSGHMNAPQITALGYWLRKAAVNRLSQSYLSQVPENQLLVARGVAFHLPPTNVDTLFVYSWALSMLAGNINVVRLPSDISPVTKWLIETLASTLEDAGELNRHFFCSYTERDVINKKLSAESDLRVIWGGDEKVKAVSRDPVRVDGLSIGFPHRTSLAVLKTAHYAASDDNARDAYVDSLYNDMYWFDQMGCGSPRTLIWIGDAPGALSEDLYQRLDAKGAAKQYEVDTATVIAKMGYMNDLVAGNEADGGQYISNRLSILRAKPSKNRLRDAQGGGLLCELHAKEINDISGELNHQTQTITHAGFDKSELYEIAVAMSKVGGFRLVPIGQALNFDETWDGISLLTHMTRRITVMQ